MEREAKRPELLRKDRCAHRSRRGLRRGEAGTSETERRTGGRGSRVGASVDVDPGSEDEAKLEVRELELPSLSYRDTAAKMSKGIHVLSDIQCSPEERATKKRRCG